MDRLGSIIGSLVRLYRKYPDLLADARLEKEVVPGIIKWAEAKGREAVVLTYPRLERLPSFPHHDYRSLSIAEEFFRKAHPEISEMDVQEFAEPVCDSSFDEGVKKAVKMLDEGYRPEYVLNNSN
jgi:hypothetical protein